MNILTCTKHNEKYHVLDACESCCIEMIEYQRANAQTSPFMIPGEDEHVDCNEARAALRQDEQELLGE